MVSSLREMLALQGEIAWSKESAETYRKYYENLLPSGDTQKDAYQEREAEQILKVAMLLSLSDGRMTLREEDFQLAKKIMVTLMTETEPRIEHLTTHPRMQLCQDIQDLLKQFGGMKQSDLIKRVYRGLSLGENQFHEAIRILKIGRVIEQEGFDNPVYRMKKEDV